MGEIFRLQLRHMLAGQRKWMVGLFLLIPIGYPAEDCTVPNIHRKALEDIMVVV